MIDLQRRIVLMTKLGEYLSSNDENLIEAIDNAHRANGWFIPEFVQLSIHNIAQYFLKEELLNNWIAQYPRIAAEQVQPKKVGIVMAGNIPLVGFHDFLCAFISGHHLKVKLSSKDTVLWKHIFSKLQEWETSFEQSVEVSEMLKGCDAYIATGSNNSARYFEFYFQKYPHIIRKNRSSVAILDGTESAADLEHLSDDVCQYFGLGCRNVTQLYVPKEYAFEALLAAFNKYLSHIDHNKFKNNYDYQLALYLLNQQYYMSNGHLLLVEADTVYAPISVVHYQQYEDKEQLIATLADRDEVQCISMREPVEKNAKLLRFGANQQPSLTDYADGVDTMRFLADL
ncbi:MAG: acyl-CoA reductase [Bacteroidetes bacterium 43-16]|nr:MAG: acyl-CoA reductase [Bacteroidetes bacterium 43-16]